MTRARTRQPILHGVFFLFVGALFLGSMLTMELRLLVRGESARAVIESSTPYRRGVALLVVRYERPGRELGRFETTENLRWGYRAGDAVTVLVNPADASDGTILSFPQMWFPLTTKSVLGMILLGSGIGILRRH